MAKIKQRGSFYSGAMKSCLGAAMGVSSWRCGTSRSWNRAALTLRRSEGYAHADGPHGKNPKAVATVEHSGGQPDGRWRFAARCGQGGSGRGWWREWQGVPRREATSEGSVRWMASSASFIERLLVMPMAWSRRALPLCCASGGEIMSYVCLGV